MRLSFITAIILLLAVTFSSAQQNSVVVGAASTKEIFAKGFDLSYVIDAYKNLNLDDHFFRPFFEKLVGVDYIRKMIIEGKSADEIKQMWTGDVNQFKLQRRPYLLYAE